MRVLKSITIMIILSFLASCAGTPENSASTPEESIDAATINEKTEKDIPDTEKLPDPPIVIDSSLPSKTPEIDAQINNSMDVPLIAESNHEIESPPLKNPVDTVPPKTELSKPVSQPTSKPTPVATQSPTFPPPSPTPQNNSKNTGGLNTNNSDDTNDAIVEKREVYALPGDDILITFNHEGWIFLGYKNPGDDQGLRFINRESRSEETLFTFQAALIGSFQLDFSYQDNINSLFQKQEVLVHVIDENGWEKQPDQDIFSDYSFKDAEDFFNQGDYTSALEILQSLEQSPQSNELAARASEKLGQKDQALEYWKKNLDAPDPYKSHASEAIARLKIDQGEVKDLFQNWDNYIPEDSRLSRDTILELLNTIENSDYDLSSIEPLLNMVNNPLLRLDQPEIYYLLGRIHEKEGPLRNFQRAKEYYQLLIQLYPTHKLSDTSRARINYINRYFILFQ